MATIAIRPTMLRAGWTYRAIWSKTLRAFRLPILAWGIGLGLIVMATAAASPSIAQTTGQQAVTQTVQSFSFFGDPVAIGTPQGYLTFKMLGLLPLFLGIWTLIAGAHLTRGDEERGSIDLLLGEPVSRARLLGEKILAFALGTTLIAALTTLGMVAGLASAKLPIDSGVALTGLNFALSSFVYGALGLFFSQFTRTSGAAAGIAGAYMAVDFVVAGAVRSTKGPEWISRLTLNYYSELSKPLIATYGANPGAMLVLLGVCVVLLGASMWLFIHRDAGDIVHVLPQDTRLATRRAVAPAVALSRSQGDLSLRGVIARGLATARTPLFWWIASIGFYGVYGVFVAKAMENAIGKVLNTSAVIKALFNGNNLATNDGIVGAIIFTFFPFVLTLAAMFFANAWSADLDRGRLETLLSEPMPRWRVPLERFVTVLVAVVGICLAAWLGPLLGSALSGVTLDGGQLAAAGLGMIPLGLITGALVYALAGRLSYGVILGVVGGLLSLSFLAQLLRDILKFPEWVNNLSIFYVYGQPINSGMNWTGTIVILVIAAVFLGIGTYRFTREDLHQ